MNNWTLSRTVVCLAVLISLVQPAVAFGAGNIASIAKIEGRNWRHGDIEDVLKTVAHLKGHKWTSMMVKRVYFGNWLRDYSQAVDVGSLKGVQAGAIRILVWILAFLSFGYATREFEVTDERLGVYRPEEHIDNPEDYNENQDARQYDPRLRPPIRPEELAVDPQTGMKVSLITQKVPSQDSPAKVPLYSRQRVRIAKLTRLQELHCQRARRLGNQFRLRSLLIRQEYTLRSHLH